MRYLKKFNENKENNKEILRIEAEESLAYLLDDYWEVAIWENGSYDDGRNIYKISIDYVKEDDDGTLFYPLKKVRDKIITYLYYMLEKYNIEDSFNIHYMKNNDTDDYYDEFKIKKIEKKNILINSIMFSITI